MCEDWDRLDGALAPCLDEGALLRRPVKVWLRGADWITRSLANDWCEGGAMDRAGGGPLRRDVWGVLIVRPKAPISVPGRGSSASAGPPLPCFWRASIICLWRSLTSKLRWSCSRMVGSWVWKPGERQARPTSCRFAEPWPEGRAVRAPDEWTMLWLERLRRCGLWRVVVGMSGDEGSFLTTILGAGPRDLREEGRLDMSDMMSL
jgi:hypothetical protein